MKHKKGNKASYGVSSYSSCNPSFIGFQYKSKKIVDTFKVSMKKNTISTFDTVFTQLFIDWVDT